MGGKFFLKAYNFFGKWFPNIFYKFLFYRPVPRKTPLCFVQTYPVRSTFIRRGIDLDIVIFPITYGVKFERTGGSSSSVR